MRTGRIRWAVVTFGMAALALATARCGSAQEKAPEPAEERAVVIRERAAPSLRVDGTGGSYLGVYLSDVAAEDVERLDLDRERGALIVRVTEDGPAQTAGILAEDVIVEWNGSPVESAAQLQRLVRETPAGRNVELGVMRDGRSRDVAVTLGERETLARTWSFRGPDPEQMEKLEQRLRQGGERMRLHAPEIAGGVFAIMSGGRLGIGIQSVGDQLGEYFGLGDRTGVLVTSVNEDSPARKAGLRAGDVIVSVNGEAIDGTGGLARAIRQAEEGAVRIGILRDRQERTLTAELPARPEFEWKEAPDVDGAELIVPRAIEGALMLVPEMLEQLELPELEIRQWTLPDGDGPVHWQGKETVRI